jgi:hypothetical protein
MEARLHSNQDTSQKSHLAKGIMEKVQDSVCSVWLEAILHNCVFTNKQVAQNSDSADAHLQHEAVFAPKLSYPTETVE